MYLLEQGKIFEQAAGGESDLRSKQIQLIQKIRGSSGGLYLQNAPRMARRLLMQAGVGTNSAVGDFRVRFCISSFIGEE
jgi:hypothetical protein